MHRFNHAHLVEFPVPTAIAFGTAQKQLSAVRTRQRKGSHKTLRDTKEKLEGRKNSCVKRMEVKCMSHVIRRDDLVMGPREKAIAAVEAGNKEEALKQIEALHMLFKPLHDRYCEWINYLFTYIAENLGEEHVGIAMKGTFDAVYGKLFAAGGKMPKRSPEQMIAGMAQGHLVHHSDIYVEEDDEKFVLYVKHCGSGSTVQKNYTDRGRTTKAYPWSGDTKGMCYYCCHEPCWMGGGFTDKEYMTYANQFDENGEPTGLCCTYVVKKDQD